MEGMTKSTELRRHHVCVLLFRLQTPCPNDYLNGLSCQKLRGSYSRWIDRSSSRSKVGGWTVKEKLNEVV